MKSITQFKSDVSYRAVVSTNGRYIIKHGDDDETFLLYDSGKLIMEIRAANCLFIGNEFVLKFPDMPLLYAEGQHLALIKLADYSYLDILCPDEDTFDILFWARNAIFHQAEMKVYFYTNIKHKIKDYTKFLYCLDISKLINSNVIDIFESSLDFMPNNTFIEIYKNTLICADVNDKIIQLKLPLVNFRRVYDSQTTNSFIEQKDGFSVRTIVNPTDKQREEVLEMMNEQTRIEIEEYEEHFKQLNTSEINSTMQKFTINANEFLKKNTQAYYRHDYTTYGTAGNPDFINHLKNQFGDTNVSALQNAVNELKKVIDEDLPKIKSLHSNTNLTVCVIPRAKAEGSYSDNQKLFKRVMSSEVDKISGLANGTNYIIRQKNTKTTHMNRSGYGGDGDMPYVGITKATCKISNEVRGKDILLIDDIYTKGVNIDEDAIQALLDSGAKSVIFYSVAKTYKGGIKPVVRPQVNEDDDLPF